MYKIAETITPILENMGYDLVRVLLMGTKRQTLQIMVERKDHQTINLDDCSAISRAVSPLLDLEELIKGSYALEISSPGINRPLIKPDDYLRFKGQKAKIETHNLLDSRRRFHGTIQDLTPQNEVMIVSEDETFIIPFAEIKTAKLAITDDLFKKEPKH